MLYNLVERGTTVAIGSFSYSESPIAANVTETEAKTIRDYSEIDVYMNESCIAHQLFSTSLFLLKKFLLHLFYLLF